MNIIKGHVYRDKNQPNIIAVVTNEVDTRTSRVHFTMVGVGTREWTPGLAMLTERFEREFESTGPDYSF